MTDFGTDISTYPDLDPSFALISGQRAVAECVARMLQTPRGSLTYAPERGYDVRALLGESITDSRLAQIKRGIEQEAMRDERVGSASASLTYTFASQALTVSLALDTADGPFALVLGVTSASLTILDGGT